MSSQLAETGEPACAEGRLRVLKFGGSSVAGAAELREVVAIIAEARSVGPIVVVVSAIRGVTDDLLLAGHGEVSSARVEELCSRLLRRHLAGLEGWLSAAERRSLQGRLEFELDRLKMALETGRRHEILAAGERLSVVRLTACLVHAGLLVEALDGTQVLHRSPDGSVHGQRLEEGLEAIVVHSRCPSTVVIVPGFIAADRYGRTVTLGRGASDLSATALTALLAAEGVEIWTDTPGILTADPRYVLTARTLERLHPDEATALARYGARVLHPEALEPLAGAELTIRVLSTMDRGHGGTLISAENTGGENSAVGAMGAAKSITTLELAGKDGWLSRSAAIAALVRPGEEDSARSMMTETLESAGREAVRSFVEPAGPSNLIVVITRGDAAGLLTLLHDRLCEPRPNSVAEVRPEIIW